MSSSILPIRIYDQVAGRTLAISVEDAYRGLWYDFAKPGFGADAARQQPLLSLPHDTRTGYTQVNRIDLDVSAWPDGCYEVYVHDAATGEVVAPITEACVVLGTTQYLSNFARSSGGLFNMNFNVTPDAQSRSST